MGTQQYWGSSMIVRRMCIITCPVSSWLSAERIRTSARSKRCLRNNLPGMARARCQCSSNVGSLQSESLKRRSQLCRSC